MDLVIRRARPSDKRDVLAAVRTLWGGNDRIPGVFDAWVTHRTGPFFVAESAGRVVGMGKLTAVTPTEAWLVLRFSTASDNTAIHRAAKTFGFARVASLVRHEAPAMPGSRPARATRSQERAVLRRVGRLVQRDYGWEWREIRRRDVLVAIARGRVFVSGPRVSAAAVLGDRYEESLMIIAIGGRAGPLRELLFGLRAEARRRGLENASFYAANAAERRAARSAGYRRPWSGETYLFEKRL